MDIKTFENFTLHEDDFSIASEIIGKDINIDNAYQEITTYIETNINNKNLVKNIDDLTNIKRKLKL